MVLKAVMLFEWTLWFVFEPSFFLFISLCIQGGGNERNPSLESQENCCIALSRIAGLVSITDFDLKNDF